MDNNGAALVLLAIVLGGFGLVAFSLRGRQRMRELVMRERIAMIEKGLVPPPERDPLRFEQSLGTTGEELRGHLRDVIYQRLDTKLASRGSLKGSKYRSAGVLLMGLGAALFLLIAFTARIVEIGFGVGGAFVMLGLAFFINGLLVSREPYDGPDRSRPTSSAATPSVPPPNVGP